MRCTWCDSAYTFSGGEYRSLDAVINQIREFGCKLVEVTGGEPLAQDEAFTLIERLCSEGYEVLVETGGYISTERVDGRAKIILDVKCPSSGESAQNCWPNLERLRPDKDEVKFVITNLEDWMFTQKIIERYELARRAKILISPAWGVIDLKELADWVSSSGLDVRLQLQLHKYIWGPEVRGV